MCEGLICQLVLGMLSIVVSLGDTPGIGTAAQPVADFAISSKAVVSNQYNLWFSAGDQAVPAGRPVQGATSRRFKESVSTDLTE